MSRLLTRGKLYTGLIGSFDDCTKKHNDMTPDEKHMDSTSYL